MGLVIPEILQLHAAGGFQEFTPFSTNNMLDVRRYYQHAHFIPIVGLRKRRILIGP